jgi:predicted nuclease of restriction endonuclease-like (RecB) superfamily
VNLSQMRRFYIEWQPQQIFQTPSEKSLSLSELAAKFPLSWSAYVRLLSVKNPGARPFYETEALRSGWSIRQLDRQIGSQFDERIALSQNKAALLEKGQIAEPGDAITTEDAIKDPLVLEFLDLKDEYSESDLQAALIQNLTHFLLELGDDFAFLGRQRRLRIDDTCFALISCSSTDDCVACSSSTSRLESSAMRMRAKCIFTSTMHGNTG